MRNISKVLLTVCMALQLSLAGCSANQVSQKPIRRLDEDGYLYYMDYEGDYYRQEVVDEMVEKGFVDSGCSNFFTHDLEGNPLTCRNYDYPHRTQDEDRTLTGLNVVLHCKPEGKYESIALADAIWCDQDNPFLTQSGPDQEGFKIEFLNILPFECMDGINEKGLSVSLLRVDIKEGEQPATSPAGSSVILRYILDDCANVEEAIEEVNTSHVTPEDWQDCHLFVTDADGNSVVIESRNGEVKVIKSDIATNFYLGFVDMEDSYYSNGNLREDAVKITNENGDTQYDFGYGHGYHRFVTLAAQLERYQDRSKEERFTMMPDSTALTLLQSVAQNPYTNVSGISMTQYSAIYHNVEKTVEVWSFQNYDTSYCFDVTGKQTS